MSDAPTFGRYAELPFELRTSELIGLQWGDLDLTRATPTASIRRAVTKLDGVHEPKIEGSARTIDLRPQVVAALKAQLASSQLKGEYKSRKPYQTRHTFASLALSAGEEGRTARSSTRQPLRSGYEPSGDGRIPAEPTAENRKGLRARDP